MVGFLAEAFVAIFAAYLLRWTSPFCILTIGTFLSIFVQFLCSYITNPTLFLWAYGLSVGGIAGSIFMPSIWILWQHIQENKGRTSGIILAGYSLGAVPFGIMFAMLANPDDLSAESIGNEGKSEEKMFTEEVAGQLPMTIRWICLSYVIVCAIGIMCLPRTWGRNGNKTQSTLKFSYMITSWKVWDLFIMMFLAVGIFYYFLMMYKILGMIYINDDHFITYVGSVSFVVAAVGRFIFGVLLDKYSWKKVMSSVYIMVILLSTTFELCLDSMALFALYVILLNFLSSSMYNSFLLQFDRTYPMDKWIFTIVSLSQIPGLGVPYFFEALITPVIGHFATFLIISIMSLVVIIQTLQYKEEVIIGEDQQTQELIVKEN
jgi:hypothetical protein